MEVVRGGPGLRHIRVGELWVQEKEENGELGFKKVNGELNLADLYTKYLPRKRLDKLTRKTQTSEPFSFNPPGILKPLTRSV